MKAIELLKLYREGVFERLKVEIRFENWVQKIVEYRNPDELEKEELLQREISDWFIGQPHSNIVDGNIVINVK
jgi:hypothetical protein